MNNNHTLATGITIYANLFCYCSCSCFVLLCLVSSPFRRILVPLENSSYSGYTATTFNIER